MVCTASCVQVIDTQVHEQMARHGPVCTSHMVCHCVCTVVTIPAGTTPRKPSIVAQRPSQQSLHAMVCVCVCALQVVKAVLEISVCHANAACGFCGAGRAVFGSSGGGAILGLLSWILALVVVPALCWFLATQSRPQTGSSLPAVVQALPPPPAAGAATDAAAAGDAAVTVAAAQVGDGRGSLMSIGSQFSDGSSEPSRPTYSHHRHRGRGPMSPNDPRRDGPCKRCTARSRDRVATCWARCAATRLRAWCGTSCTRCRRRTQCCYQPGQEEVHKRKISVYRFIEKLMKVCASRGWTWCCSV